MTTAAAYFAAKLAFETDADDVAAALATLLLVIADRVDSPEIKRYEAAIRGNADYLANL